ncbi:MAG TPA: fibronectin type III-like domain-contianing protein [Terriglobales bacterium]|nr:fibronectin type III-like domain-contianing protein [Terriglobales bacterium]
MARSSETKSTWSEQVIVTLDQRAISFYDVGNRDWSAEPGEFSLLVRSLSAETKLKGKYLPY